MTTIAERVEAGARWLDENRPGWVDRIDLDTLDLGDPCRCVLGQLWDRYELAPLSARYEDGDQEYGDWIAGDRGFHREGRIGYSDLTDAWRALIVARRAQVSARGEPTHEEIAAEKRRDDV